MMSISDGLGPSISCRKMEKARPMSEKMDGKTFISRQSRHSNFDKVKMLVLFPICTLNWHVNNYVSRQQKGTNRWNESMKYNCGYLL